MAVLLDPPPGSPLWWLDRLDRQRRRRLPRLRRWEAYYTGDHPLTFITSKYRKEFGELFKPFSDNWMALVVSSVEERLNVSGFRFPVDDTEADVRPAGTRQRLIRVTSEGLQGDRDAWYMWQANNLDGESIFAHTEALVSSIVYTLVDPTVRIGRRRVPQITIEHPEQMIVATAAGNRRQRLAALKCWRDDDGRELATVYLPHSVHRYQRGRARRWEDRQGDGEAHITNPLGVVPVISIENRDRLLADPAAEFDNVIPLQNAVNMLMAAMLVAAEYAAFRQRWVTGIEIPQDEDGNDVEPFKVAIDRLFVSESADARFGSFEATDLSNYVEPIEMAVQHLASQSSTPAHYMLGHSGSFPSGESLNASETGLVAKVGRRAKTYEPGWEDTVRLGFAVDDDDRADILDAETIWSDPESRSESEHVDATLKKLAAHVPIFQIWEDLGYSPQQIRRFRTLLREQALEGLLPQQAAPAPPPVETVPETLEKLGVPTGANAG